MPNEKSLFLCHHGIKGMHWGQRHGPPYPLSKEVSRNIRINRQYEYEKEPNKWMREYRDRYIASQAPPEKFEDLQRKTGRFTLDQDAQLVNDVFHRTKVGRLYNCQNCAAAVEMRARGYDVTARMRPDGSNVFNPEKWFDGGKFTMMDADDIVSDYIDDTKGTYDSDRYDKMCVQAYDRFTKTLSSQPIGSRGIVTVGWCASTDIQKRTSEFHAFNYIIRRDGLVFVDAEGRGKLYGGRPHVRTAQEYMDYKSPLNVDPREYSYMRTDHLTPNESITEAVISRKLVDK